MGANVIVVEADPLKALEAVMDGLTVLPMLEAARQGEVFVTVTGNIHIIRKEHFEIMRDGAVVCNSGHFNVELDIPALEALSNGSGPIRDEVVEYRLKDGRRIYLLSEGRLINLAAAEGHPASVMDMSFANQRSGQTAVTDAANWRKRGPPDSACKSTPNRSPEAGVHGREDRRAYGRAEEMPGVVGDGNVGRNAVNREPQAESRDRLTASG
jgi:adenosylhomocysteinase